MTRFVDAVAFARRAQPFLEAHEAEHSLPLGILAGLAAGRFQTPSPLMMTVELGGAVVSVALRTPPFPLVLSLGPASAMAALAAGIGAPAVSGSTLPGVNGPRQQAELFATAYAGCHSLRSREVMAMRLYRLDTVPEPNRVPGRMRAAADADRKLLEGYLRQFHDDARAPAREDPAQTVDAFLRGGDRGLHVWETGGRIVSMAGFMAPTAHGVRLGAVFTPPEERRHGYASALVATLSRKLLQAGRSFCVLYTDLANPTSNAIYRRIGYRPVLDAVELAFEP